MIRGLRPLSEVFYMGRFSFLRKVEVPSSKSMTWTKTWVSNGVKNVQRVSLAPAVAAVGRFGGQAGKTIVSWGTAAKGALVAFGGVVAYKWFGSGIPAFFADITGTDERTGSFIAIGVIAVIVFAVAYGIYGRIRFKRYLPRMGYKRWR